MDGVDKSEAHVTYKRENERERERESEIVPYR